MSRAFTGGKRQREANRDRRKKDKEERLRHNRQLRAQGIDPDLTDAPPEALPEVRLEDVVIAVAPQERRNSVGPVKLFVGGLSWGNTTEDLRNAFGVFGAIEDATVILDRSTGRSRGFGFVTFANAADAVEAVKKMDGAQLDGRTLKVNNAESR
jgi:RNA recognition motif-containing protein